MHLYDLIQILRIIYSSHSLEYVSFIPKYSFNKIERCILHNIIDNEHFSFFLFIYHIIFNKYL